MQRGGHDALDVARIKKDFPLLQQQVNGKRIVYLDSASSSQKPQAVLDAMDEVYNTTYANVHRGVYEIAAEATERYEEARGKVARFIGAPSPRGMVFTKNVTEAINLVAYSWGRANLHEGDAVVLTEIEHHANLVPWLMLQEERGIELRYLGVADDYTLDLSDLDRLLDGAKLLSFTAMSNVLGTLTPVRQLADAAHAAGALLSGRRRAARAAPPHRRHRARLRLLRLHRPQDVRPHRHRRAVGPRGAARGDAAVPRRRRDDPRRPPRRLDAQRDPVEVRSRARRRSSRPSASAPPSTTSPASAWTPIRQHEIELTGYALRTLERALRRRHHDPRARRPARPRRRAVVRLP